VRREANAPRVGGEELGHDALSPLFQAVAEASEEAIYNSLFMATTLEGNGQRVEALPLERVRELLREHGGAKR